MHLVGYLYWVILRCTDPWILNLQCIIFSSNVRRKVFTNKVRRQQQMLPLRIFAISLQQLRMVKQYGSNQRHRKVSFNRQCCKKWCEYAILKCITGCYYCDYVLLIKFVFLLAKYTALYRNSTINIFDVQQFQVGISTVSILKLWAG